MRRERKKEGVDSLDDARFFRMRPNPRVSTGSVFRVMCGTLGRGKCGPIGRVIKCVVSKSPACVADFGKTEDLVVGIRHSRLMRRLLGTCVRRGT